MRLPPNLAALPRRPGGELLRRFAALAVCIGLLTGCAAAPVRPAGVSAHPANDAALEQCASLGAVVAEYYKRPSLTTLESEERALIAALIAVQERGGDALGLNDRVWEGRRHLLTGTAYNCSVRGEAAGRPVAGQPVAASVDAGVGLEQILPGMALADLDAGLSEAGPRRTSLEVPGIGSELIAIDAKARGAETGHVCIVVADDVVLEAFEANPDACAYLAYARAARFAEARGWTDIFSVEKRIYQAGARMLGASYVDYGDRWQIQRIELAKRVHAGEIGRDEFDIHWNQYINDQIRAEIDRRQACAGDGQAAALAQQRGTALSTLDQTLSEMAAQRPYADAWQAVGKSGSD